jgi:hypothetical protein
LRPKHLLGPAVATALAATGLLTVTVPPAQAAQLPCNLTGSGSSATADCYSGSRYTWRLVVDCVDTSNPKLPRTVTTLYGKYRTGDGTETLNCHSPLRADGRIEAK